jgi:hypothetical protein
MSSSHHDLLRVNRYVNRWAAAAWAGESLAGLAAVLWLACLADVWLPFNRAARVTVFAVLAAGGAAALVMTLRTLWRRRSPMAVAALIERHFPQLDNHLINVIQLGDEPGGDPLARAYVAQGAPAWTQLDRRRLIDMDRLVRDGAALLVLAMLWTACLLLASPAWSVAARRLLNPFSDLAPATTVTLLAVTPGHITVNQGDPLTLTATARGRAGQKVSLEWRPDHDRASTLVLGTLTGSQAATFTHAFPSVTDGFTYRIRAGDARPSDRFRVTVRPPLAFASLKVHITPPPYTRLPAREVDLLAARLTVPQQARLDLAIGGNRPITSGTVTIDDQPPVALIAAGDHATAALSVASGRVVRVAATDPGGATVTAEFPFDLVPDRPPVIRLVAPLGRVALAAGGTPRIQFEAADDYGLSRLAIQRVPRSATSAASHAVLQEWVLEGDPAAARTWTGEWTDVRADSAFQVVALDTLRPGEPNRTLSALILFDLAVQDSLLEATRDAGAEAAASLARLIELQQTNLAFTVRLHDAAAASSTEDWQRARNAQTHIRRLAGELMADPRRPLGPLDVPLRRAHEGPMADVIDTLDRVSRYKPGERTALSPRAIEFETQILKLLTGLEAGLGKVSNRESATGLLAMIDTLVKGQRAALDTVRGALGRSLTVPASLAARQDALASDLAEFIDGCRAEADRQERADAAFAKAARAAAALAETRKIRAEMLAAAEHLEANRTDKAVDPQTRALEGLVAVQDLLNRWRVQDAEHQAAEARRILDEARAALEKLIDVQAQAVDSLRAMETQKDRSNNDRLETIEENAELKAQMEEALAKLANDLQVLPNLPVGNELVEDISLIYEEVKQVAGSDQDPATELGLQKEDWILAALALQTNRMDDMEMWLVAKPDAVKRNTETFDLQEMPEIALVPLPEQFEDIIGDLLEQQEKIRDESDDSTGNQGVADLPAGWGVAEGEFTDYAAKGKSGNERPEHKDQDGRSGVGRQGMSDGEVVTAAGKINEGDKNIDKRMTRDSSQAGQIQEEGHTEAKATGGGKQSGYAEGLGMSGPGPRRDPTSNKPSPLGAQAMLRRNTEAVYAKASMRHIRTGQLDKAAYHMRQAEDALAQGQSIRQVREFQQKAVGALRQTRTELSSDYSEITLAGERRPETVTDEQIAAPVDEAPARYRGLVSEYFKALSEGP